MLMNALKPQNTKLSKKKAGEEIKEEEEEDTATTEANPGETKVKKATKKKKTLGGT